jgi:hypothetical protein
MSKIMSRFMVFFGRFNTETIQPLGAIFALIGVGLILKSSVNCFLIHSATQQSTQTTKKKKAHIDKSSTLLPIPVFCDGCGLLLLVQVICYSVLINGLANLSFSPLHLNITARMWQQVCANQPKTNQKY